MKHSLSDIQRALGLSYPQALKVQDVLSTTEEPAGGDAPTSRWEDKAISDRNGDALLVGEEYPAKHVTRRGPTHDASACGGAETCGFCARADAHAEDQEQVAGKLPEGDLAELADELDATSRNADGTPRHLTLVSFVELARYSNEIRAHRCSGLSAEDREVLEKVAAIFEGYPKGAMDYMVASGADVAARLRRIAGGEEG